MMAQIALVILQMQDYVPSPSQLRHVASMKAKHQQAKAKLQPRGAVFTDGWTEWKGGVCPVMDPTVVGYVRLRNGTVNLPCRNLGSYRWGHNGPEAGHIHNTDIVAYKLDAPEPLGSFYPAKTDWYPGTVAPFRPGVYELCDEDSGNPLYARFDGAKWFMALFDLDEAMTTMAWSGLRMPMDRIKPWCRWRGFTSDQNPA